jgi:hypothetical protein
LDVQTNLSLRLIGQAADKSSEKKLKKVLTQSRPICRIPLLASAAIASAAVRGKTGFTMRP